MHVKDLQVVAIKPEPSITTPHIPDVASACQPPPQNLNIFNRTELQMKSLEHLHAGMNHFWQCPHNFNQFIKGWQDTYNSELLVGLTISPDIASFQPSEKSATLSNC